jgi:hypothetical protein
MIYFVRCGKLDWVKIGTASDIAVRVQELQSGSPFPLRLTAVLDGGRDVEARLHKRFARERGSGEWFALSPRLRAFIGKKTIPATEWLMRPSSPNMQVGVL